MPYERIDESLELIGNKFGKHNQRRVNDNLRGRLPREEADDYHAKRTELDDSLSLGGRGVLDRFKRGETERRALVRAALLTEIANQTLLPEELPAVKQEMMRQAPPDLDKRLALGVRTAANDAAEILRLLQTHPDDLNLSSLKATPDGGNLLHFACRRGDLEMVNLLIERDRNLVNAQDRMGNTPLHAAITNAKGEQHADVVQSLFDAGAQVNLVNSHGETAVNAIQYDMYATPENKETRPKLDALDRIDGILSHHADYGEARLPHALAPGQEQRLALQVIALVHEGHMPTVASLAQDDPLLNQAIAGKHLVHVAAEQGHEDVLRALVGKGAAIDVRDSDGNNALHHACKSGTDSPAIASYLLEQLGERAVAPNAEGKTALHLAAVNNLPLVTRTLLGSPRSEAFNVPDHSRLKPLDYAVGKSDTSTCEQEFYRADPALDRPGPSQPNPTVVDTLVWMTRAENPGNFPHEFTRKLYEDLYADPTLRPVLEVAARDGIGSRTVNGPGDRQALRIVMADNVGALGGGGMGNFMDQGNRLNFGGKQNFEQAEKLGKGHWEDAVKGTVIHELTHHAAAAVFRNDGLPHDGSQEAADKYIRAFEADVKLNSHLWITPEEKEVARCISSRLETYQKPLQLPERTAAGRDGFTGRENMQLELIVGVSQAVAQFGEPLVNKLYPNLTNYYKTDFTDAVKQSCINPAGFGRAQIDTATDASNAKAVTPLHEKLFVGKDAGGESAISPDKVWEMVRDEFTFAKGRPNEQFQSLAEQGIPLWHVDRLEVSGQDAQTLKTMEDQVKPLLAEALASGRLPAHVSTDAVRGLARGISNAYSSGLQAEQIPTALQTAKDTFVADANLDFQQHYLPSRKANLDRKMAKEYTLDTREVAELAIANHNAAVGRAAVDLHSHEQDVQALIEQFNKLPSEQLEALQTGLASGSSRNPLPARTAGQEARFQIDFGKPRALQDVEGQIHQARLDGGEVPRDLAIEHAKQLALAQADYGNLKKQLLGDVAAAGEPNTKLAFDDVNRQIHIDYSYKDCIDRFGDRAKKQIKQLTSPGDEDRKLQDIFREQLGIPEVRQRYDAVLPRVTGDYRAQGLAAYKEPDVQLELSHEQAAADNVNAALAGKGICLGEEHSKAATKNFLVEQMPQLKNEGVTTLFIEHFWQEQQEMLDAYMRAPKGEEMPAPLKTAVKKLDDFVPDGNKPFTRLLEAAKDQGIRVVGLDSFNAKTAQNGDPRNWDHRAARFNATAAEVVDRTLAVQAFTQANGPGKFVLLAGEAHINTHTSGFPGMAQILGVPAVQVAGGKLEPLPEKKNDRGMRTEAEQQYYDAFVDTFMRQQPDRFRPNEKDTQENTRAETRGHAVNAAADALAREHGAALNLLSPRAIESLAGQAAQRTIAALGTRPLDTDREIASTEILTEARSLSGASAQAAKDLRMAVERKDFDEVGAILQRNPNDDRLLIGAATKEGKPLSLLQLAQGHDDLTQVLIGRGYERNPRIDPPVRGAAANGMARDSALRNSMEISRHPREYVGKIIDISPSGEATIQKLAQSRHPIEKIQLGADHHLAKNQEVHVSGEPGHRQVQARAQQQAQRPRSLSL